MAESCVIVLSTNTLQGSVAMPLRCGGIFTYCFGRNLLQSLSGERILKIS